MTSRKSISKFQNQNSKLTSLSLQSPPPPPSRDETNEGDGGLTNLNDLPVEERERILYNEEFHVWSRNSPHLYNLLIGQRLAWPSITAEWMSHSSSNHCSIFPLVLGTFAANDEKNSLLVYNVQLSNYDLNVQFKRQKEKKRREKYFSKVSISKEIDHQGRVNRARSMPHSNSLIATKSSLGKIFLYNIDKQNGSELISTLEGDSNDLGQHGTALSWSVLQSGNLLSVTDEGTIYIWDVNNQSTTSPLMSLKGRHGALNDAQWSHHHSSMIASCGNNRKILFWDYRKSPKSDLEAVHSGPVRSISFNPFCEYQILSASNRSISLWDTRDLNHKLHSFDNIHQGEISQVKWSPVQTDLFASSSSDQRVFIFNLANKNYKSFSLKSRQDEKEGPPELAFIHGSHRAPVWDLSWNIDNPGMVASVDQDNWLYVWKSLK